MFGLNPYALIAGGVATLGIIGGFYFQDRQIHHYHNLFNNEHDNVVRLDQVIQQMKNDQTVQLQRSADNVTRVITVPGKTQLLVKTVHDAPLPADCATPEITEDAANAF